ncbi:hypothetical protein OHB54_12280 [Streptomyces sp. NBC_01007]|nr:hypothetical protein OHB54_12280 [Streptomyces sp. NBC_01007]
MTRDSEHGHMSDGAVPNGAGPAFPRLTRRSPASTRTSRGLVLDVAFERTGEPRPGDRRTAGWEGPAVSGRTGVPGGRW